MDFALYLHMATAQSKFIVGVDTASTGRDSSVTTTFQLADDSLVVVPTFEIEDRENLFRDYLLEFWVDQIDLHLNSLINQWIDYVSLPEESHPRYDALKKAFVDYDNAIFEDIRKNTYFFHQTHYLKKYGIADSTNRSGLTEEPNEVAEEVFGE